jgi:hypothetical protein
MLSLNTPLPGRLDVWTVPPCCTNVNVSVHATPITARPWAPPFPPLIYLVCTSLTPWSSDGTAMLARIRAISRAILTQTTARQVPCWLKLGAWSRQLSAAIQISAGEPARLARAGAASCPFTGQWLGGLNALHLLFLNGFVQPGKVARLSQHRHAQSKNKVMTAVSDLVFFNSIDFCNIATI